MTGRQRFLTALANKKPDRLPCQIHGWMTYYLETYLDGIDQWEAYSRFGMDKSIYLSPHFIYNEKDLSNWDIEETEQAKDKDGNWHWLRRIKTPERELRTQMAKNEFTTWVTEHLIKDERDFDVWNKYVPIPERVDWTNIEKAMARLGDDGIIRTGFYNFGQGSPWQDFCELFGIEKAIMATFGKPEWVHMVLESMLKKKLSAIERAGKFHGDLVETGGGAGSSTVISPDLHREFCLPYDMRQHEAFHNGGIKVVYHLCGGLMPLLDIVVQNKADGLETMTPSSMGGDCDLVEARKRIGDKMFFIGGFDQNAGFERGTPEKARKLVYDCHSACPDGGYICSPSDHFFFGVPENIQAFADASKECRY